MTERPSALPLYTRPLLAEDPDSFGPYLLLARIASGATGTVHLSRDSSGAWVAVRALHPAHARRTDVRARFAAAATRAHRVSGRTTCAVVDAAIDAVVPYVVFEFVDGPTLADEIAARGPLAPAELRRVALDVASAVASLQQARVVHGALEPSDVVLSLGGARLVDLGTARLLASLLPFGPADHAGPGRVTEGQVAAGQLVAPEVRAGGEPLPATDVFGWANLVVLAATGRPSAPAGARPAPVPGVDPTLAALLAEALRDDPAARPAVGDVVSRLTSAPRTGRRGRHGSPAAAGATAPTSRSAAARPPRSVHAAQAGPPTRGQSTPTAVPEARPTVTAIFDTTPDDDETASSSRSKRVLVAGAVFLAIAGSAAAVAPAVSASGGDSVETAAGADAPDELPVSEVPRPVLAPSLTSATPLTTVPSPTPELSANATEPANGGMPVDGIGVVPLAPGGPGGSTSDDESEDPPAVLALVPQPSADGEQVAVPVVPVEPAPVPPPASAALVAPPAAPTAVSPEPAPQPPRPTVAATPTTAAPPSPSPTPSPSRSGLTPVQIQVVPLS